MSKPIEYFKVLGARMLSKWAKEREAAHGGSNVLSDANVPRDTNGGQGGWPPGGAGMLSPLAEQADLILTELRELDPRTVEYLVAHAMDYSVTEMVELMEARNRSQVNIELKEALAFWTAAVYYRGAEARGMLDKIAKIGA